MSIVSAHIRKSRRLLFAAASSLIFLFLSCPRLFAQVDPGGYVGWKACGECHRSITTDWQKTKHADAFKDLEKSGQEELPACVGCHVTGLGQPGGFVDKVLTPDLGGVQCEVCHGPGKKHATSHDKGAIIASPGMDTCRECHTPTQDAGFDYAKKIRGVHTPEETTTSKAKASSLTAAPDYYKFAPIDEGKPAIVTVTIRNTGNRQVEIANVRTS